MAINPELLKRLQGIGPAHGQQANMARGAPIYNGGSMAAHQGGGINYPSQRRPPVRTNPTGGGPAIGSPGVAAALQGIKPQPGMLTPTQLQPRFYTPGVQQPQDMVQPPSNPPPPQQPNLLQQLAAKQFAGGGARSVPQTPSAAAQSATVPQNPLHTLLPPPVGPLSAMAHARFHAALRG